MFKTPGGAGTHERYYVVKEFDASKVRKKLKQFLLIVLVYDIGYSKTGLCDCALTRLVLGDTTTQLAG